MRYRGELFGSSTSWFCGTKTTVCLLSVLIKHVMPCLCQELLPTRDVPKMDAQVWGLLCDRQCDLLSHWGHTTMLSYYELIEKELALLSGKWHGVNILIQIYS